MSTASHREKTATAAKARILIGGMWYQRRGWRQVTLDRTEPMSLQDFIGLPVDLGRVSEPPTQERTAVDHQIDALRYAILRAPPVWQDVCEVLEEYLHSPVRHERLVSARGAYHVLWCDGASVTVTDLELLTQPAPDVRGWAEALDRRRRAAALMPRGGRT